MSRLSTTSCVGAVSHFDPISWCNGRDSSGKRRRPRQNTRNRPTRTPCRLPRRCFAFSPAWMPASGAMRTRWPYRWRSFADPVDAGSVCESGWRWGFLARQEAEGRKWYRLAPPSAAADTPPDRYLAVRGDEGVAVDLDAVPFEALETLVLMSDQRPVPGRQPLLLVTPNLVKLGRATDTVAALPLVDWLQKNAQAFHQAFETVRQRRGKTILHENLSVARVSDLSLKVALEKVLGRRIVPLGEEFLAFPSEEVAVVKRLVAQMGHVVKEVAHREP